ncbi:hypothetical protein [Brevundimonas sp.]|uniref:hypothetical protein n=1 Tax=Brevundimonas sp. TaxID=1871086 RepID=UPI0025C1FAA8|nr:hypothetical protein [Brevundimonas sp.]
MSGLFPASTPEWARQLSKAVLAGAVFGAVGYAVGQFAAKLFPGLEPDLPDLRWADIVAGLVAAVLLVSCLGTAITSFYRRSLGRVLKLEGPAGDDEVRDARRQSAVLGLSGIIMILPMILSGLALPVTASLAGIGLLLVLHTALNLRLYRSVDELFRRVVVEAGALTFWLGQGLLFIWAAAERLAVAPPLTAWDIYVVLMSVYLIVSMVVTFRRGLA